MLPLAVAVLVLVVLVLASAPGRATQSLSGASLASLDNGQSDEVPDSHRLRELPELPFSLGTAEAMVSYAAAVTCADAALLTQWSCKLCESGRPPLAAPPALTDVSVAKDAEHVNQALVGYDAASRRVVVSFRGSVDASQWIFDLDVVPVARYCRGCLVHQGFALAWGGLAGEVVPAVRRLVALRNASSIYFTGHSLGAAMAVHAALDPVLGGMGVPLYGYTFGQPRVGNAAFAAFADARLSSWFRVVNYKDPVPQCPKAPSALFRHMATEVFFFEPPRPGSAPGPFRVCSRTDGEDPGCQDALCGGFKLCLDGDYHVSYLNMRGITNVSAIC